MATRKTYVSLEVTSKNWHLKFTEGLRPDRTNLTDAERKECWRHDKRIIDALVAMPEPVYQTLAGYIHCVDRYKHREALKAAQKKANELAREVDADENEQKMDKARTRFEFCCEYVRTKKKMGDTRTRKQLWMEATEKYSRLNAE